MLCLCIYKFSLHMPFDMVPFICMFFHVNTLILLLISVIFQFLFTKFETNERVVVFR